MSATHVTVNEVEPEVGIDVDAALAALEADDRTELDGALGVRALLLRLRQIGPEREYVQRLMSRVVDPYTSRVQKLNDEEARIRGSLAVFLRQTKSGKVAVPDAGTVYLTTTKPKVVVEDQAALLAWWEKDAGREVPMTDPTPDVSAIRAALLAELQDTGEVPPAGAGVTVVPAERNLAVRLT